MGEISNKGFSKDDKKEGILKKLRNIEDKNEQQLQVIKDQGRKQLEQLKNIDKSKTLKLIDKISQKNDEANKLLLEFKKIDKNLRMQILFVQDDNKISLYKLIIKLNMTLIIFFFH